MRHSTTIKENSRVRRTCKERYASGARFLLPGTCVLASSLQIDSLEGDSQRKENVMFFPELESGALVRFKLASVVCPDQKEIVEKVTEQVEFTGRVVLLSDGGEKRGHFAVVEVTGIATPLIVPVDQVATYSLPSEDGVTELARE
jgi:hypothetical protein